MLNEMFLILLKFVKHRATLLLPWLMIRFQSHGIVMTHISRTCISMTFTDDICRVGAVSPQECARVSWSVCNLVRDFRVLLLNKRDDDQNQTLKSIVLAKLQAT
jgi:hypothetical protein